MCNETIQPPEAVSGRFGRESFRLGRFGLILRVGCLFRPNLVGRFGPIPPSNILYSS